MISLKSKKDKKKMMKGGSITDREEKKIILDALNDFCDSILDHPDFTNFNKNINLNTSFYPNSSSFNLKYNYLYFSFKYFFGMLFEKIFNNRTDHKTLLDKMYDYINFVQIINSIRKNEVKVKKTIPVYSGTIDIYGQPLPQLGEIEEIEERDSLYLSINKLHYDRSQNIELYLNDNGNTREIDLYLILLKIIRMSYINNDYDLLINEIKIDKIYIYINGELLFFDNNEPIGHILLNEINIKQLITLIYNFIINNFNFNDFKEFINSSKSIIVEQDTLNHYTNILNLQDIQSFINNIFFNIFNTIFKKKLTEKDKDVNLENTLKSFLEKSIGVSKDISTLAHIEYLRKKAIDFQYKSFELIDKQIYNEELILFALECFKYYNSLNDYNNSIAIIKNILNLNFDDTIKTKEFYKLYLILALLYYYSAINNFEITDGTNIDQLDNFNNYINNLLSAIYYFNIYFTNINNDSNTTNQSIIDIINNSIQKYDEYDINILIIYNKIINDICKYINKITNFTNDDNNRKLLQLLLLAYTFYKIMISLNIQSNIGSNISIIYPLKDNNSSGNTLKDTKLKELLSKTNKDLLLGKLIEQIQHFKTTELLRLFFFRNEIDPNSFYIDKMTEFGIIEKYNNYIKLNGSKQEFINNVFDEILKFEENKTLPYGLDVLLSIYKYNFQIPLYPNDVKQDDKYKNYVLEVFNNKDDNKEQYEFFKTLLNIFYMNISVLYYNLFTDKPKLFETLRNKINSNTLLKETNIKKKEIVDMEFKEENKADIISVFIYHLKTLFQQNKEITFNNIHFLLILFNNLYTSNETDLMKFIYAMYGKIFEQPINYE